MSSAKPFTFSEREGLILLAETSAVSACAIIGILSYIAYGAVSITRGSSKRWRIESPAQIYFLNQLAWDLLQALGGLMNLKWAIDASVHPGPFCTAQGAVKHVSDVGAAFSTLIIAIYSMKILCFSTVTVIDRDTGKVVVMDNGRKKGFYPSLIIVNWLWVVVSLIVVFNLAFNGPDKFYGPTGFWCWIQPHYSVQRTAADFLFMWIAAAVNIVIYLILFLYFRGYIIINGWHITLSCSPEKIDICGPLKQAYGLLFFPLVYTVAILPVSIARYSTFAHHHVPYAVTIFVDMIYLSNGLFDVLLFSITRPLLLPHDPPTPLIEGPDDGPDTGAYAERGPNYHQLQPRSSYDLAQQLSPNGEASLVRPLSGPDSLGV